VPTIVFGNAGVIVKDVKDPPLPVVTIIVGISLGGFDVIMTGNGKTVGLTIGEFPA
jgi:hypothetical protein